MTTITSPSATTAVPAVPAFGLGTFRLKDQVVIDSVKTALALGYRHIDTAQIYGNEAEVGQAIAESGVPRDELFITTKVWTDHLAADRLIPSLKESLAQLRTDRVDLALIHWPAPGGAVPVAESLGALADAQAQGLTRAFGVSNFNTALLREAIAAVGADRIATNQIEPAPLPAEPCGGGLRTQPGHPHHVVHDAGLRPGAAGPGDPGHRGGAWPPRRHRWPSPGPCNWAMR